MGTVFMITNFYYSILLVEIIHNITFLLLNPNGEYNKFSFPYLIFKKQTNKQNRQV